MSKTAFALGLRAQRTGYPEAVQQLKLQTQKLLGLADDVTISVTELSCREPGCPDVETVVAILREGEKPSIAKVHRSIPEVTPDELKAAFELALPKTLGRQS
ncbi:nitrate reductase [Bradyrhizobium sp. ARR65]|uniref:nitrate reductase n=1 Tax=Bradyrhizobium sp. ARR65 TaxID=1040989 RepID=UPI000AEDB4E0|nr:nitrate reductase [Bradyrhizobium sp. ARR65]